ncbi:2092_t:CDS:10 [Acaulospora morrowiae]|uniref:2092_t:CDS:1 n=1 Tax=Acaulospora morrowiae TaxID=94023 RepID=A0A9N8ZT29_9GLOM|nr:2092_t:CDS:10 [Acaulospora morrowiae]
MRRCDLTNISNHVRGSINPSCAAHQKRPKFKKNERNAEQNYTGLEKVSRARARARRKKIRAIKPTRQRSQQRTLGSNADRYKDLPSEDTEIQDGGDSEIDDFKQMIDHSEDRSFDPSTYFQFKEEKEWNENIIEADEIYKNLMNIQFDDLNMSLCSVPLHERLDLADDIFLEESDDFTFDMKHPFVPKSVRSINLLHGKSGDTYRSGANDKILAPNTKTTKRDKEKRILDSRSKPPNNNNTSKVPISSPSFVPKQPGKSGNTKNVNTPKSKSNSLADSSRSILTTPVKDDEDIDDFLKSLENEEEVEPKNTSSSKFPKRVWKMTWKIG